jgi:hypothetical protein
MHHRSTLPQEHPPNKNNLPLPFPNLQTLLLAGMQQEEDSILDCLVSRSRLPGTVPHLEVCTSAKRPWASAAHNDTPCGALLRYTRGNDNDTVTMTVTMTHRVVRSCGTPGGRRTATTATSQRTSAPHTEGQLQGHHHAAGL